MLYENHKKLKRLITNIINFSKFMKKSVIEIEIKSVRNYKNYMNIEETLQMHEVLIY